jgi:putative lipoic acid-binding regulatory protein
MANHNHTDLEESLIEFPCDFPIKVMGKTQVDFSTEVIKTIQKHAPTFDASKVEMKGSSKGNYTSLTCLCYIESKLQLDNIYRALTSHPLVKYVL